MRRARVVYVASDADLSDCGLFRYALRRVWDPSRPVLVFAMLNPSKADALRDDATIRVCVGRAALLGYGGVVVVNLYAYRSTSPAALGAVPDPVGPRCDAAIAEAVAGRDVVCAWGDEAAPPRVAAVLPLLRAAASVRHLGLTRGGQPRHPLRVAYSAPLLPLELP